MQHFTNTRDILWRNKQGLCTTARNCKYTTEIIKLNTPTIHSQNAQSALRREIHLSSVANDNNINKSDIINSHWKQIIYKMYLYTLQNN